MLYWKLGGVRAGQAVRRRSLVHRHADRVVDTRDPAGNGGEVLGNSGRSEVVHEACHPRWDLGGVRAIAPDLADGEVEEVGEAILGDNQTYVALGVGEAACGQMPGDERA